MLCSRTTCARRSAGIGAFAADRDIQADIFRSRKSSGLHRCVGSLGISISSLIDISRHASAGWPAGAAAPPANADTPPLYTPEAVVADLPWILFYDLYHDTAAQMETSRLIRFRCCRIDRDPRPRLLPDAKQDIADNLMDWVRRFLEYCIKNSHATANMHPADRKILRWLRSQSRAVRPLTLPLPRLQSIV